MKNFLLYLLLLNSVVTNCQTKVYSTKINIGYNTQITGGNVKINQLNNYSNEHLPDSVNFGFRFAYLGGDATVEFYPVDGSWGRPFVLYPSDIYEFKNDAAFTINGHTPPFFNSEDCKFGFDNKLELCKVFISNIEPCNFKKRMKLTPAIFKKKPRYIVFGDYDDKSKWYIYEDSNAYYVQMRDVD